jgi:hypothetical protein
MAEYYARSRRLDPVTGEYVFDEAANRLERGHPGAERLVRLLRTRKGRAARDPNYGIDLDGLENDSPNAPAVAAQRVRAAVAPYIAAGIYRSVAVTVERTGGSGGEPARLMVLVEFVDPRDGQSVALAPVEL